MSCETKWDGTKVMLRYRYDYRCTEWGEKDIIATMDAMTSSGLRAAGYNYVNLDDCVVTGRFDNGKLNLPPTSHSRARTVICFIVPALRFDYLGSNSDSASLCRRLGTLYTDPKGFPSGTLKPLTSYAHAHVRKAHGKM